MTVESLPKMTPSEFLDWEREQPDKWEYVDGRPRAMAGAGTRHLAVTPQLPRAVNPDRRQPCRYRDQDTKLWVHAASRFFYPDGMIACPPHYVFNGAIDNPTVIFEVLSPGTSTYDQGEKFGDYESVESLREIVFIDSSRREVRLFRRSGPGEEWSFRRSTEGSVTLPSVGLTLALDDLYAEWDELPEDAE